MSEGVQAEMPRYRSHKIVWALKIKGIEPRTDGGATITPEDAGYGPFQVDGAYVRKHTPQIGGYYVVYSPDGYQSWSPAREFEDGYTRV